MATRVSLLLVCAVPIVASLIFPMKQSNGNPDIDSVINHVALMEQRMDALQKQVQTSNMNINTLTTELKYANEKIASLEQQATILTHDQDGCKTEIAASRTSAEANFTRLHGLILENQRVLANTSKVEPVGFQAYLNKSEAIMGSGDILKFDVAPMNLGGAYNKYSGMFTVPVSGVYMFWANILVTVPGPSQIELVKNGTVVETALAYSDDKRYSSYASMIYLSEFQKGDTVFFQFTLMSGYKGGLHGLEMSNFGGVLLR